jgi:hypothetical protein
MNLTQRLSNPDRRTTDVQPIVERRADQPRWLRIQRERVDAMERTGRSRFEAVRDTTDLGVAL